MSRNSERRVPVVIAAPADLRSLRVGKVERIELALQGLDPRMRAEAEARLARILGACGCTEGAVGLIAALPLAIGSAWSEAAPDGLAGRIGLGLAIVVAGSLIGKLVGLLRAQAALRAEVGAITAALGAQPF